ncbi:MAG: DUF58 domain-containing protein, partial [Sandaracinaceae bacterium]|nr:DUF58 domain-containing protein [Sandaracinaceae bacterium]
RFPPCGMIWISELHPTSIHLSESGSPLTIQPIYLDWMDSAGVRHFKSTLHPSKRGRFQLQGFLIRTRFPFGLLEAWRIIPSPAELVVYPPWRQVNLKQWLINHQYPSDSCYPFFPSDSLDDGTWLRPYREGDELRRVHALRSASLASLVVREDARSTTTKRLCLRFSPSHNPSGSPPDAAALEEAIARLASAAQIAHDEGWIVDVLLPGIGCISIEANDSMDPLLTVLADFQPSADWSLPPPPQGALVLEVAPSYDRGFE